MYIYIYMYVYIYIYINYVCVYIYIYIYMYMLVLLATAPGWRHRGFTRHLRTGLSEFGGAACYRLELTAGIAVNIICFFMSIY